MIFEGANRMTLSVNEQEHRAMSTVQPDRRRLSQGLIASCIVLVAFLVLGAQSLYGQADALFIDKDGNVSLQEKLFLRSSGGTGHVATNAYITRGVDGNDQWRIKDPQKKAFTLEIRDSGELELYGTQTDGQTDFLKMATFNAPKKQINFLNGNVGIGTETPGFPLTFPDRLGDKISLWGQSGVSYGFGIQGALLQIHTSEAVADVAFGYGKSCAPATPPATPEKDCFTETMRIKGNGNVGIGTKSPSSPLDVRGNFRVVNDDTNLQGFTGYWNGSYTTINSYKWSAPAGLQPLRVDGSVLSLNSDGGNVGIGRVPEQSGAKLQVSGGATISGAATINGDLTVTGKLILPNGWAISSSTPNGLVISRNGGAKMGINDGGALQYDVPGLGYYFLVYKQGTIVGPGSQYWTCWESDNRLKTDLRTISFALDKVNKLNGITYHWNQAALDYFTRDIEQTISAGPDATPEANQKVWQAERARRYKELSNTNVGVVAQDVEAVLPQAVTTDKAGYKQVAYHELIPLLIEALKEEDKISREQAQTIARQQSEIQRLTVATEAAQQQLNELQQVKQKLGVLRPL